MAALVAPAPTPLLRMRNSAHVKKIITCASSFLCCYYRLWKIAQLRQVLGPIAKRIAP